MKLPSWAECKEAVDNSSASPIQEFIYKQEPAGINESLTFRILLGEILNHFCEGEFE